jgi:N-acetylglutamate synthase/N-acetylornithine aminotransferase
MNTLKLIAEGRQLQREAAQASDKELQEILAQVMLVCHSLAQAMRDNCFSNKYTEIQVESASLISNESNVVLCEARIDEEDTRMIFTLWEESCFIQVGRKVYEYSQEGWSA